MQIEGNICSIWFVTAAESRAEMEGLGVEGMGGVSSAGNSVMFQVDEEKKNLLCKK